MSGVLYVSDLHFGAGADYGAGSGSRLFDQRKGWLALCDAAYAREADVVVFAGDVFHRPKPTPAELMAFQRGLHLLEVKDIPVLIVVGNHDVTNDETPTACDVFANEGVLVERAPRVVSIAEREFAVLPWTPISRVVAQERGDRDALRAEVARGLIDICGALRAQCQTIDPVLVLHWSVGGARTATGQEVVAGVFREVVLDERELAAQGWGRIVAGHIHKRQKVGEVQYLGSAMLNDFGEEREPHGALFVGANGSEEEWVETPDRPFQTVDANLLSGGEDAKLDATLWDIQPGAVVRVRYAATAQQVARQDHGKLRRDLVARGASRVFAIQPQVERDDRVREDVAEDLTPTEALQRWMDSQSVPKRSHGPLMDVTRGYLGEVGHG